MARTRDIKTNQVDLSCDICGRTLLRGEHAETYLAGGARREVCDLCTVRAEHAGWIREAGADDLALRQTRPERGRSFRERLRARELQEEAALDGADEAEVEPIREPRHVRAVPTNADLKMARALELFNASEHPRTVAGVARSLGPPEVTVRPLTDRPSVVAIIVMWELSWYRYEIDLSDEAGGVRRDAQGDELTDLSDEDRVANATADERGALTM